MTKGTPASSQIVWLEGEVERLRAENETLRRERDDALKKLEEDRAHMRVFTRITELEAERDAAIARAASAEGLLDGGLADECRRCGCQHDSWQAHHDAVTKERDEARDLSWFWEIVDRDGLANVASDEKAALRELVRYAAERDAAIARAETAEAEIAQIVEREAKTVDVGFALQAERDAALALLREAAEALEPFAAFADAWDKQPLRGIDDRVYSLHGETHLKLSDCKRARVVLNETETNNAE